MAKTRRSRKSKQAARRISTTPADAISSTATRSSSLPRSTSSRGSDECTGGGTASVTPTDWSYTYLHTRQSSVVKRKRNKRKDKGRTTSSSSSRSSQPDAASPPPTSTLSSPSGSPQQSRQTGRRSTGPTSPSGSQSSRFISPTSSPMGKRTTSGGGNSGGGDDSPSARSDITSCLSDGSVNSILFSNSRHGSKLVDRVGSLVQFFTDASRAASQARVEAERLLSVINHKAGRDRTTALDGGPKNVVTDQEVGVSSPGVPGSPTPSHGPASATGASTVAHVSSIAGSTSSPTGAPESPQPSEVTVANECRSDGATAQPGLLQPSPDCRIGCDDFFMRDVSMSRRPTDRTVCLDTLDRMITSSPPLSPRRNPRDRRGTADTIVGLPSSASGNGRTVSPDDGNQQCYRRSPGNGNNHGVCHNAPAVELCQNCKERCIMIHSSPPSQSHLPTYRRIPWQPPAPIIPETGTLGSGGTSGSSERNGSGGINQFQCSPGECMCKEQTHRQPDKMCCGSGHAFPKMQFGPALPTPTVNCAGSYPHSHSGMAQHPPPMAHRPPPPLPGAGGWVPASVFVKFSQACAEFVTAVYSGHNETGSDPATSSQANGSKLSSPQPQPRPAPTSFPPSLNSENGISAAAKEQNGTMNYGCEAPFEPAGETDRMDKMDISSSIIGIDD